MKRASYRDGVRLLAESIRHEGDEKTLVEAAQEFSTHVKCLGRETFPADSKWKLDLDQHCLFSGLLVLAVLFDVEPVDIAWAVVRCHQRLVREEKRAKKAAEKQQEVVS